MRFCSKFPSASVMLILSLLLGGCTFSRQRINDPNLPILAEQVESGVTTAEQLTGILGFPNSVLPLGDGKEVYLYSYGDVKTKGFNLLIFGWEKSNAGFDSGYFLIDRGIVKEKLVSTNSQDLPWEWWPYSK